MDWLDIIIPAGVVIGFIFIIIANIRRISFKEQWLEIVALIKQDRS